ncbi:MAG: hypothetical protein F6K42_34590 [Leptolyngbya sp. SIO1D8]|nr:hypothetical protein [Leptolyngbya sp. SIO1D8]
MSSSRQPDQAALVQLATEVLDSPALLRKVSDRVYALLQAELRYQRDRSGSFYRRLL